MGVPLTSLCCMGCPLSWFFGEVVQRGKDASRRLAPGASKANSALLPVAPKRSLGDCATALIKSKPIVPENARFEALQLPLLLGTCRAVWGAWVPHGHLERTKQSQSEAPGGPAALLLLAVQSRQGATNTTRVSAEAAAPPVFLARLQICRVLTKRLLADVSA